ncbi:MAG: nicotinate-nucleotide diphosphorylase (carboxylating) [Verrucomicrobia bacterium]|nr:MAG: nicotinate-nucleotide diphosphorylase (carboxylating) [Verrucomicrobiota bacterium]
MDIIDLALYEDIGDGDVTSAYFVDPQQFARAVLIARESCVLAGGKVAEEVFRRVEPSLQIAVLRRDGERLEQGDQIMDLFGKATAILTAERTALNFIQRLSGVATLTRRYVDAISGTHAILLDTRKTTPGLRKFEKAAIVAGGGTNHRIGLFDKVLVKDNHLATMSRDALVEAIARVRRERPGVKIELEADTLEQVRRFAALGGVERILLDNMTPAQIREALTFRKPDLTFEASGGIHLENIKEIAATGVDYISVGGLTHAARAIDLALDFQIIPKQ